MHHTSIPISHKYIHFFQNIDFDKGLQLNQIQVPLSLNCHGTSLRSFQSSDT